MTLSFTELRDVVNKCHASARVSQNGPFKLQPKPAKQKPMQQKQGIVLLPETTDQWIAGLLATPNPGGAYIAGDTWWKNTVPTLTIRWLIQHGFQLDTFKLNDAGITEIIMTVKNAYERGQLCRSYDKSTTVPLRSIKSTIGYIIMWYRYWYDKAQIPQSTFVPVLAVYGT
jgi:hypothetical protein